MITGDVKGCSTGELEVSIYDVRRGKTDHRRSNKFKTLSPRQRLLMYESETFFSRYPAVM